MKLHAKLALGLAPASLAVLAAVLYYTGTLVHQVLIADAKSDAVSVLGRRARAMADAFASREESRLLPALRACRAELEAVYAEALDRRGEVLAHTVPSEKGRRRRDEATLLALAGSRAVASEEAYAGQPYLIVAAPVWNARARVGTLRVALPLRSALATEEEIARGLVWVVGGGLITGILLALLLVRRLLAPLAGLAEGTARVARGDYGVRVPAASSDEFGDLSRGFNAMAESLERTSVSKDFLSDVLSNMPDALIIADARGHITTVNPAALELLGYDEQELVGRPLAALFPEEDRLLLSPALAQLNAGGRIANVDLSLRKKCRERVPVIFSGAALRGTGSGEPSVLVAAKDITERKQSELLLDGQARLLQEMLSGAPLPALLASIVRQIESQVPSALAAVFLLENDRLRAAAAPRVPAALAAALETSTALRALAPVFVPAVAAAASWEPAAEAARDAGVASCWSGPVLSRDGQVLGVLCVLYPGPHEVSASETRLLANVSRLSALAIERRRAEEALRRSEASLRSSEKLSAVGQLAAGVAHEINNPLAAILGFAQAVAGRIEEGGEFAMPLESIVREAKRCKTLVSDLLTFSRQSKPRQAAVDLNEEVRSTLRMIAARARVSSVLLSTDLAASRRILGDANQLQQVLVNLCNNAVDAMPQGGSLTVRTREASDDGGRVILEVHDTGGGIPAEIRDRIFNPFFTTKEVGRGTGLGLALVHEIVSRHQGTIEVSSAEGEGSLFRVSFPVYTAGEALGGPS